jgi:hypothetical protein
VVGGVPPLPLAIPAAMPRDMRHEALWRMPAIASE